MNRIAVRSSACRLALLVAGLLMWCPTGSEAGDSVADKALCTRIWGEYLEAVRGLQPEKVAAWFTKDAVLIYPDIVELSGREAIRAHFVKVFPDVKIFELTFRLDRFEVVGSHAYTFATVNELVQEGSAPQARLHARCAVAWQQQPDMSWQIAYFIVNYAKV